MDEVLELLLELDATDEQLDSPMLFCSGRNGTASYSPDEPGTDLKPLFDTILDYIPAPEARPRRSRFQMLVSAIDYNEFVGRIAIGRIERGALQAESGDRRLQLPRPRRRAARRRRPSHCIEFDGLGKVPVTEATAGNIIAMSGIGDITIGDTICAPDCVEPLPFVKISAPTIEMTFSVNDSPFAGTRGQVRHLPPAARAPVPRDAQGRLPARDRDRGRDRRLQRRGPRRDAACPSSSRPCAARATSSRSRPRACCTRTIDGKKCEPIERLVVRRAQRERRRGHREDRRPQGRPARDDAGRRPHEARVPGPAPRPVRLPQRVPDRHASGEGIMAARVRLLRALSRARSEPPQHRLARRLRDRRERHLRPVQRAGARRSCSSGAGVPVYEGMVVGVSPQAGGHHRQRLQEKAADQHARRRLRRRAAPRPARAR